MKYLLSTLCLLLGIGAATAQTLVMRQVDVTQTIRGQITDVASGEPIMGVVVKIDPTTCTEQEPALSLSKGSTCTEQEPAQSLACPEALEGKGSKNIAVSDVSGCFTISNVPVGRHTIMATYIGYEPLVLKEQLLSSGKEMVLQLQMRECVNALEEVVVKPRVNKQQPLNEMAQTGARMFSVEEATRYAGGMADPARTASMFAGVAASGATNGISIHGNSPQMLQWRIEGIEVNNPNHFAEVTEAGGGVFSSLNGTMLANSDFLTGAMPAEYGNALSGAFDMKMRSGNNTKYEHAFQLGTLGIDFASEGPLGRKGKTKASYLINYRYSFLEVAKKLHAINMDKETLDYQDLSFKINMPTRSAGTFSVWFTGLYDRYVNDVSDMSDWKTLWDSNDSWSRQWSIAGGLSHSIMLKSGGRLRSSIAMTGSFTKVGTHDYDYQMVQTPNLDGRNNQWNIIIDVQHQHKISSRYTMQNGFNHQHLGFKQHLDACPAVAQPLYRVYSSDGSTGLTRVYSTHKILLTNRLSAVGGINIMWFNLNNQWLFEPRASISYKTSSTSTLSMAYAMNSRKENTDVYFVEKRTTGGTLSNKNLGLTRSHHLSLTFAQRLGNDAQLKIEPYYQYVFDVPVEQGSTFSMINNRLFYVDRHLVNDGAARNYGIDLTIEHYLKNGYYGMFTATLFKSEYRDAQRVWHSSRYDRRYITNLLGGKEWMVGRHKSNVFGINGRITLQGGDKYSSIPDGMTIDDIMQRSDKSVPEDTDNPFNKQTKMNVGYAFSVKYTINRKCVAHHFILEYLKMNSFHGQTIDLESKDVVNKYTSLTFPNIAYRVEF